MMEDPEIWATLGIGRTEDQRAIRKAYAARLKSIDVDAEPGAFIALREARDLALYWALHPPEEELERPLELVTANETDFASDTETPPPSPSSPWASPEPDIHMNRLQELLYSEEPEPELREQVRRETNALLAHPALGEIGRAEDIEQWLAYAIVDGIPRSDAMLGPAIRRFDWEERAAAWDCPPIIHKVLARDRDIEFRDQVAKPGKDNHEGYRALTGPPPSRPGVVLRFHVDAFLRKVRVDHPSVERDLDQTTLAWWSAYFDRRSQRFPFTGAALVALFIAMLQRLAQPDLAPRSWLMLLAAITLTTLGWFALRRRLQRSRQEEQDYSWHFESHKPSELAALAGLIALPIAALLTPAGPATMLAFGIAAAVLALFAGVPPRQEGENLLDFTWRSRLCLLAPIVWLHAMHGAGPAWLQVFLPLCVAAWVIAASRNRIEATLDDSALDIDRFGRPVRGVLAIAGFLLWFALIGYYQTLLLAAGRPLLSAIAVTLLLVHDFIDPPERFEQEWNRWSVIAVLAVAVGGPAFAGLLVAWRSLRTVARFAQS